MKLETEFGVRPTLASTEPRVVRKVLHVIPSVGPMRGGPSVMVRNLARSLVKQGIETHIVTTDDNGLGRLNVTHRSPVIENGVTYWYFPRQTRFYTFSWPLTVWLQRHVAEFDVIHIHALFSYATLPAAYCAARRGVPYIVRPLGTLNEWGMKNRRPWLKSLSFRWIESRVLKHAAAVHYTSKQERTQAAKLGVDAPARIVPNALPSDFGCSDSTAFFARFPQARGRRLLLFLSRLDAKKGLDLLLPAIAAVRLRVPDAMLVIAGGGSPEFTEKLKNRAIELQIEDAIIWAGFLTGELKQSAFAAAEVYVLPSYSENFGIAVIEAMATGLPVIVSDQVAVQEDITRSEAGLVVCCDVSAIEKALFRLLTDFELRRDMGTRGRAFTHREYSSEAVTANLIDVYNEFIR